METKQGIKTKNRVSLISALVFAGLISVLGFAFFGFSFSTNDDVMIKAILSGDITGTPDGHTVYVLYALGWVLKSLYTIWGNVAWYDLLLFVLHLFAYVCLIFRAGMMYKGRKPVRGTLVATVFMALLLVLLDFSYFVLTQYTILSAMLMAVAVFYYATAGNDYGKERIFSDIVIGISLIFSLLLRKQVFLMGLPVMGIVFLYRLPVRKGERRIPLFITVCVLAIGILLIEKAAYRGTEWQDFEAYNKARTDVYDYYRFPEYDELPGSYEDLGITREDMYPLGEWDLALFDSYQKDSMQGLADLCGGYWKAVHYQKWEIRHTLGRLLNLILHQDVQPIGGILTVLFPVGIIGLFVRKRRKAAVCLMLGLSYQGVFAAYFLFRTRFPERVSYGLYLMEFFLIAGIVLSEMLHRNPEKETKQRTLHRILICVTAAALLAGVVFTVAGSNRKVKERTGFDKEWQVLTKYFEAHPDKVYFLKTSCFSSYGEKMFTPHTKEGGNFLRMGSWIIGSPLYEKKTELLGCSEPWNDLYFADNIYYVQYDEISTDWIKERAERTAAAKGGTARLTVTDNVDLGTGHRADIISVSVKNPSVEE